jgi:AcrR family transcriptional regulator
MKRIAPPDTRNGQETRERIFDAAEILFLEHGFDGTSLRMVTARAGVNLAAVNYHFGGKHGLFREMLARRLDPLNEARLELLGERRQAACGVPLDCDQVLAAMFIPALALARDPARGGRDFLRLLGRAYVDPSPVVRDFLSARYAPTIETFKDAFAAALPDIPRRELAWRLHFMMGALAYTLAGADAWRLIAALNPPSHPPVNPPLNSRVNPPVNQDVGPRETDDDERLLRRLAPFLIAGLKAPLPDLEGTAPAVTAQENPPFSAARISMRTA